MADEALTSPGPRDDAATSTLDGIEPAGIMLQLAAMLLDLGVLVVTWVVAIAATFLLGRIFEASGFLHRGWSNHLGDETTFGEYLLTAGWIASLLVAQAVAGATPGKLAAGLRIMTTQRGPCTLGAAIMRTIGWFADGMFFGLVGLGAMNRSKLRQRVGDRLAGTVVVPSAKMPLSARRSSEREAGGVLASILVMGVTIVVFYLLAAFQFEHK